MAFVFIQHLDPHYPSELRNIFAGATSMDVRTIENDMAVEPNTIYVIPPNATVVIERGVLKLQAREQGLYLPVDTFLQSLAKEQGSRGIAVILSGNASDGSQGVLAIKAECGVSFAQDESSARFTGMPRNAAATGAVDFVLPPPEIAVELTRIGSHPYVVPPTSRDESAGEMPLEVLPDGDGDFKKLFGLLHAVTGVDFTHYKRTTVRRRIGRRMIVHRAEHLRDYVEYAQQHPAELKELYRDLLIVVTNFFREPETFESLRKILIGTMSAHRKDAIRVWVPGCATGEEVYSLAICIYETLQDRGLSLRMQMFGTDISDFALSRAREGIYSGAIAQDVSPERLGRFFLKVDSGYQISKSIRESCVFARQDLTRDPPFSHLDIVSCRNVLIYLDMNLQKKIIPIFHYSLRDNGLLLLGSSEAIARFDDLFERAEETKIFIRKPGPAHFTMNMEYAPASGEARSQQHPHHLPAPDDLLRRVDRIMQHKYAPAALVVTGDYNIVQFRGHTSPFLDPSPGPASLNLLRMARESLIVPLRRAFHAAAEREGVVREKAVISDGGPNRDINLEVTPVIGPGSFSRHYLVVFEDPGSQSPSEVEARDSTSQPEDLAGQLQRELSDARDQLRNLAEDHAAHLEELQAANEEVRSANEELQSTNEELSTTKEELQSSNEELTTVNEELRNRNRELSSLNDDLKNLFAAVNIPILIVDSDIRIRRFTEASEKLLDLGPPDIGRRISHVHGPFAAASLENVVKSALETLRTEQIQMQDHSGTWYTVAARPYRTIDNRIDGALLSFMNIDPMKRGLQAAEQARDYAEALIETVREPLVVLDADLRVRRTTSTFYELFQVTPEETLGRFFYDLGNGQWNVPRLRGLLGEALFRNAPFQDFEIEHEFPHIGRRTLRLNGRRISLADNEPRLVLLAIENVTERVELSEIRYRRLFEAAKDGIVVVDADSGRVTDVNPHFLELSGYAREQFVGKELVIAGPFPSIEEMKEVIDEARHDSLSRRDDVRLRARDGREVVVEIVANRYVVGSQQVIQFNIRDVSERRRAESALRESEQRFRLFADSVQDYALFMMDLNGRIMSWNTGSERVLGYKENEIIGHSFALLFPPEDVESEQPAKELAQARREGRAQDERWHVRKDGTRFWATGVVTLVRDDTGRLRGFAKIMHDSTERKRAQEELQSALREKELLLREIHHRVKNNLQVISSILSLQSQSVGESAVAGALDETRNRVRAIATIHEMLFQTKALGHIEIAPFLEKIAGELPNFYDAPQIQVNVSARVSPASMDIEKAVPCGLIVNELVSNALKHAFPDGQDGRIDVSLQDGDQGQIVLSVRDNGRGLPLDLEHQGGQSLGLKMVHLLADQLGGKVQMASRAGAEVVLRFPA
jgi:two-component system CheB/CheR fusion protein